MSDSCQTFEFFNREGTVQQATQITRISRTSEVGGSNPMSDVGQTFQSFDRQGKVEQATLGRGGRI